MSQRNDLTAATRRLFAIFVGVWLLALPLRAELKVGDAFPSLANAGLQGGEPPAIAGHVTLVDFWASWCVPCKKSFPFYAQLQQEYAARGVVIVALGVDEKRADYDTFIKRLHPSFVTLHDSKHQIVAAVGVPTMPTAYLLGRDGRVRYVQVGFHGADAEKTLREQIQSALAENAPAPIPSSR